MGGDQLALHVARLHGGNRAAHGLHAVDLGLGTFDQFGHLGLDDVRAGGRRILPLCPFVKDFVDRHPEYADLVVDD